MKAEETVAKIIQNSGLSESEISMLALMDSLIQKNNESLKESIQSAVDKSVEEKLKAFEENTQPIYNQMIIRHIEAVNKGMNKFLKLVENRSVSGEEVQKGFEELKASIESKAVEEATELSSDEMKRIYNKIVPPLKEFIEEQGIINANAVIKDNGVVQSNIIKQIRGYGDLLYSDLAQVQKTVNTVRDEQRKTKIQIDGIGKSGFYR